MAHEPKPNVQLLFNSWAGGSTANPFLLDGYLDDEGIKITLKNEFDKALVGGSIFEGLRKLIAGGQAWAAQFTSAGQLAHGYIQGGIMMNSPYFWLGTQPIDFNLTMYRVAQTEGEIIATYQKVLQYLSPATDASSTKPDKTILDSQISAKAPDDQSAAVVALGAYGPATIDVHYFPGMTSKSKVIGEALTFIKDEKVEVREGRIQFLECLCSSATMDVKAPYDPKFSPIIGIYTFALQTSRIVDRNQIEKLFTYSSQEEVQD